MTDTEGKKVVLVMDDAAANLQIVRSILNGQRSLRDPEGHTGGSSFRQLARSSKRADPCLAAQKSESERLCGTLGKGRLGRRNAWGS